MSIQDTKATVKLSVDDLARALAKDPEPLESYVQLVEPPEPAGVDIGVDVNVDPDEDFEPAA